MRVVVRCYNLLEKVKQDQHGLAKIVIGKTYIDIYFDILVCILIVMNFSLLAIKLIEIMEGKDVD